MNSKPIVLTIFIVFALFPFVFAQKLDTTKVYELDPVVITGTRIERLKSEIPASISVLSQKEIQQSGYSNVLRALADRVPGLFLNSRTTVGFGIGPGSGGNISIRGVSGDPNSQILMLIDGQPQFMGIFGHPINDSYMSSDIQRVEVIRGPASILYGSNAMGGAINIITKEPTEGLHMAASAAYGSYNTSVLSGDMGYREKAFSVFASVNNEHTDGPRDDGNDEFRNTTGYLKLGYQISDALNVTWDGSLIDAEYNNPGTIQMPTFSDNRKYTRGRTAISLENNTGKLEGAFKFFYNFGKHNFSDGFHSNDYNRGLTFYQNIKWNKNSVLTVGLDYKNFGGKPSNQEQPTPGFGTEYTIDETDAYLLMQQTFFHKLTANIGYRLNNNSQYGIENIPTFGLAYKVCKNTVLKTAVTKGFRSPSIIDLYLFPVANAELEPESLWNYEFTIGQTIIDKKLNFEITGFIIDGKNMIEPVVISAPPPTKINTGTFTNRGIEFTTNFNPTKALSASLNYTFLYTSQDLKYAPKHELNVNADYQIKFLTFGMNLKYVNGLITQTEPKTENDYALLNLHLEANVNKWLDIFVSGNNLFDAQYQIDYGYPMPGVNYMAGVKLHH